MGAVGRCALQLSTAPTDQGLTLTSRGCAEIDLGWGAIAPGLMRALVIVELEVAAQPLPRFPRSCVIVQVDLFVLTERHIRSTKMLSSARPRPSMLIRTLAASPQVGVLRAGEMAALIAVPDLRFGLGQLLISTPRRCQHSPILAKGENASALVWIFAKRPSPSYVPGCLPSSSSIQSFLDKRTRGEGEFASPGSLTPLVDRIQ